MDYNKKCGLAELQWLLLSTCWAGGDQGNLGHPWLCHLGWVTQPEPASQVLSDSSSFQSTSRVIFAALLLLVICFLEK